MITIHYLLSEAGRKAALAGCFVGTEHQTVQIERGAPVYGPALELATISPSGRASVFIDYQIGQGKPVPLCVLGRPDIKRWDTPMTTPEQVVDLLTFERERRAAFSEAAVAGRTPAGLDDAAYLAIYRAALVLVNGGQISRVEDVLRDWSPAHVRRFHELHIQGGGS